MLAAINGYDITEETDMAQRSVSMITSGGWVGFQNALTIKENLEFFAVLYGLTEEESAQRIDDALEVVGLKDKENEAITRLSSGMRQRMVIAKELLVRPPIFFMDEPTVGLDPQGAIDIQNHIRTLNKKLGQTIFMTTHYMHEAEILCDRVAIIHKGKIIACDTPDNLKRKIRKEEVIEIGATNLIPAISDELTKLESLDTAAIHIDDKTIGSGTIRIHTKNRESALPQIIHLLEEHKVEVRYIKEEQITLEDVFIKLVGAYE